MFILRFIVMGESKKLAGCNKRCSYFAWSLSIQKHPEAQNCQYSAWIGTHIDWA